MRRHLDMEVAFISQFRDGRRYFRFIDSRDDAPQLLEGMSDPLEDSYCQRVVDGRLPELIHDATSNAEALSLPVTLALPVGAHVSVPLRFSDGEVYGTFCCFSTKPDTSLNSRDVNMMHIFGDFIGRQLEQEERKHSEDRHIEEVIRQTLQDKSFHIFYQPIIDLTSGDMVGVEALARFEHQPYRSPDLWFKDAARVGLRSELEIAVIDVALEALQQLPERLYVAVNISPESVSNGALEAYLLDRSLKRIVLELTEHEAIEDYQDLVAHLYPMRQNALRIAVDDAGAGYASFRHILHLRPDLIKMDNSLTLNIEHKPESRALAAAILGFASQTSAEVVAEGVENAEAQSVLHALGAQRGQGYHIAAPMPLEKLLRRIDAHPPVQLADNPVCN